MGADTLPLKNLITNVPDWLRRLDDLNGQIEQRQLDLAKLEECQKPTTATRSLRRTGSTESLRPKDEGVAFPPADPSRDVTPPPETDEVSQQQQGDQRHQNGAPKPESPKSTSSTIQRQTREARMAAQKRARAIVRKRQKTDSVVSMEDGAIKYRSRTMIIVYYDSYVQSFFEELVKFVSASRNLMRKAKMAAKVAEIKRLAELEMPDDDDDDENDDGDGFKPGDGMIAADPRFSTPRPQDGGAGELRPRFTTTRQTGLVPRNMPMSMMQRRGMRPGMAGASSLSGGLGKFNEKGDIYDDLDRGLDNVQSMCERAAHQFLRDGDCSEDIEKIKDHLARTKDLADKEMERIHKEIPGASEEPEPTRSRSYRPTSMRRDTGAFTPTTKLPPTNTGLLEIDDEGVQDVDDVQSAFKTPRLMS
ncbi:hypothetical protein DL764_003298 [Monosporascus ibericus]|uniref:Uncharacterized protein n=1 Tax=Monosporascus ibericus TaxID=155417 RepID=A0A4Q4TH33_9PEZI|nr:hypothetical protein DL764_003298 [Monosporascus ibericus]